MLKIVRTTLASGLLAFSGIACADIADDLMAQVNSGKTLAEAVQKLVAENPQKAKDIVTVAEDLIYQLSPEQCALDHKSQKPLIDCSEGIVAAAIGAGADPVEVNEAAAAGAAAAGAGGTGGIAGGAGGGGGGLIGSAG